MKALPPVQAPGRPGPPEKRKTAKRSKGKAIGRSDDRTITAVKKKFSKTPALQTFSKIRGHGVPFSPWQRFD
jgi:hypothetical protein